MSVPASGASLLALDRGGRDDREMNLTSHLSADRRAHVEARLHGDHIAWLTSVRPSGRPDTVPVWFLAQEDETLVVYSQPGKLKLRNIERNPNVALGLDGTDLGRDVVRIEGTALHERGRPGADQIPEYVTKYREQISALFRTPSEFASQYSEAIVITVGRLLA